MEQAIMDVVYLNHSAGLSKAGNKYLRLTCADLSGEVMTVYPASDRIDAISELLSEVQPFDKLQLIGEFQMGFNGWRFTLKDIK